MTGELSQINIPNMNTICMTQLTENSKNSLRLKVDIWKIFILVVRQEERKETEMLNVGEHHYECSDFCFTVR